MLQDVDAGRGGILCDLFRQLLIDFTVADHCFSIIFRPSGGLRMPPTTRGHLMDQTLDSSAATPDGTPSRRSVLRAGAWSIPVVALAVASPAAAASVVDVGAYALQGSCGTLGVTGPGFGLTASPTAPLPVGTTVVITGSGVANIGVFSVSGGTASVAVLSGTSRLITLTSEVPAGATIRFRTTLSITTAFQLNAAVSLPDGYSGTGAKSSGSVSSTLILCSAS
jgi:hypothetical protein